VVGITDRHRQRIIEHRGGLAEPDATLALLSGGGAIRSRS
jgi:hypothetical protein